jgi:tetratricopeptide (TPR) repeat protein
LSVKAIKKKLVFHEICQDLGIEIYEDQFDFVYLQGLSIFLLDQAEHEWAIIFELPDVREAFHKGFPNNNFEETNRLLDHHLHVTIKSGPLKSLNTIPENLLTEFANIYREQVQQNAAPSIMEIKRTINDAKIELLSDQTGIKQGVDKANDGIDSMKQMLQQLLTNPAGNSFQDNSSYQDIIDVEHQSQLDFIKKLIDNKSIDTAQSQLLSLKERIGETASAAVKGRLLNNIGYTFIMQDKQDEAISYYQEALKWTDKDIPPITNLIGLYFAKKRYADAAPLVEKLKDSNPAYTVALTIYLTNERDPAVEPDSLLPSEMQTNAEALVAIINVYLKRDLRKALYYSKLLYASVPDSDNYIDIYCNIALIALVGEKIDFETRELQSEEDKKTLFNVRELMEGLWQKFEPTEYKNYKTPLLDRLALLQTVLGDHQAAIKTASQSLAVIPESYNARKLLAMNHMFSGDYVEAANAFDQISAEGEEIWDYLPAWMISRGKAGRIKEVEEMANLYLRRPDSIPEDHLRIYAILAFLLVEEQQFEKALETIEHVIESYPDNIGILADKARILHGLNRIDEENECTARIVALTTTDLSRHSIKDRYIAANYLCVIGNFTLAADLMASFIDPENNNELTLQLADAYARSGRKGKALLIYENLRSQYGISPQYTRREIEVYYFYRDYAKAIEILELYNKKYPEDWRWWLNLGGLYLKINDREALGRFCKVDTSGYEFTLEELQGYIPILHQLGYSAKCLDLIYDYRRNHPGAEANRVYINYCLHDPLNKKDTDEFKTVKKNAVVFLKDGSMQYHYIIEDLDEDKLLKSKGEVNLQSKIFKNLKDKRVGAKLSFNNAGEISQRWQITAIIPKYRFAFHESMRENTTIYAEESGVFGGQLRDIKDLEKMIVGQIKKQENVDQLILESEIHYELCQLPLCVFAGYNSKNPIEIYDYFISKGTGIRYSIGNVHLYNQALQLCSGQQSFVLDVTALLSLHRIGFKNDVKQSCRLIITPATRELIENHVADKLQNSHTDHVSFFEHKGQKVRMLVKAEDKKAELVRLQDFLTWVNDRTETIPCKSLLDFDTEESQHFSELFGGDILESALLSQELGALYISDDAATRRFVEEKFQVKGVWTQPVLKIWVMGGIITDENYNEFLYHFIKLGHQHTTIDSNDILLALVRSDLKITGPFEELCSILSGKFSDDQSVNIAFSVISGILLQNLSSREKENLIYFVLMRFISYRCLHPLLSRLSLHAPLSVRNYNELLLVQNAIAQLIKDIGL